MTSAQLAAILAAIPGSATPTQVRTNATRAAAIHHRTAVTAPDVLPVPATPSMVDVTAAGSLLANTAYKLAVSAGNYLGQTPASVIWTQSTSNDGLNTHAMNATIAQATGATLYHLFMSTDAAPKYVAQITEAQRAAGCTVTAMGTVTATSPGAGIVQIQVAGTGVATGVSPFVANTAYSTAGIDPINCAGYSKAHVYATFTSSDLRTPMTAQIAVLEASQGQPGLYSFVSQQTMTPGSGITSTALQTVVLSNVDGATGMIILFAAVAGQGTSVDLWVELE